MAALDTNVLVRWIMDDEPVQCGQVAKLREQAQTRGEALWVSVTVLLELEWVLRSRYRVTKQGWLALMLDMVQMPELKFDSEPAIELALDTYELSSAEFADCLHNALAYTSGQAPLLTFDAAAARLEGAQLVTA